MRLFRISSAVGLIKLNSRVYKQKFSVGVVKSVMTRANVIDLIAHVVDAD